MLVYVIKLKVNKLMWIRNIKESFKIFLIKCLDEFVIFGFINFSNLFFIFG